MGCPNARAGVRIVGEKASFEQPKFRPPITTSGVVVALVVPILVGTLIKHAIAIHVKEKKTKLPHMAVNKGLKA